MGWSEFRQSTAAWWADANESVKRAQHLARNNAKMKKLELKNGKLTYDGNFFKQFLAKDCTIELVQGSERHRMTATRMAMGTAAAGPLGGMVGMLSTKNVSKSWIFVTTPAGEWKIKLGPKHADATIMFLRKYTAEQSAQLQGDVPD